MVHLLPDAPRQCGECKYSGLQPIFGNNPNSSTYGAYYLKVRTSLPPSMMETFSFRTVRQGQISQQWEALVRGLGHQPGPSWPAQRAAAAYRRPSVQQHQGQGSLHGRDVQRIHQSEMPT